MLWHVGAVTGYFGPCGSNVWGGSEELMCVVRDPASGARGGCTAGLSGSLA